jgi:TetR/AcrR family transcriptional regulator, transcriptional repressor for nem operon
VALIDFYLSAEHRDHAGEGCPTARFGPDLAREDEVGLARAPYMQGVEAFARWLTTDSGEQGQNVDFATVSMLVGAIILARATAGSSISDEILQASRAALATR